MGRKFNPLMQQNTAFNKQRCQARFRNEAWDPNFTFEVWWSIWQYQWHLRGRQADDWHMIRIDTNEPWSEDNVDIVCRRDWLKEVNQIDTWCSRRGLRRGRPKSK